MHLIQYGPNINRYGRKFPRREEINDRYDTGIFQEIDGRDSDRVIGRSGLFSSKNSANPVTQVTLKTGDSTLLIQAEAEGVKFSQGDQSYLVADAKLQFQPYHAQLYIIRPQEDGVFCQMIDRHGDSRLSFAADYKPATWTLDSIREDSWEFAGRGAQPDPVSYITDRQGRSDTDFTIRQVIWSDPETGQREPEPCFHGRARVESWELKPFVAPSQLNGKILKDPGDRGSAKRTVDDLSYREWSNRRYLLEQ